MEREAGRIAGSLMATLCLMLWSTTGVQAQAEFEPAKLEAFVTAAMKMNEVIEQWQPRVDTAWSEAEAETLRERAEAEITAAIARTEGISVGEYRQIYDAAGNDPQLRLRLVEILEHRAEE